MFSYFYLSHYRFYLLFILSIICSIVGFGQISRLAKREILNQEALQGAHIGINIYEPATNKHWYNYQGNKYFIPASNTKIPTCYATMKYLGDHLPGLNYRITNNEMLIMPTGDPSFLHPDFKAQPVYDFLRNTNSKIVLNLTPWDDTNWGKGWAWDDYLEYYMPERTAMPIYGNVVRFSNPMSSLRVAPSFFAPWVVKDSIANGDAYPSSAQRELSENKFTVSGKSKINNTLEVPFYTQKGQIIYQLLQDTLHRTITTTSLKSDTIATTIYSQPTDSLLKIMMHRSDNFFAEQSLLMVSNQLLGNMNDEKIIQTILETDFKDLPQEPRWVDGSGLSRYNLFTPQDFVAILHKMKDQFGMDRIKIIFTTGGQGTLENYYKSDSGYIYAKTGTLTGIVALSGFLYTKHNRLFIFSILINNHQTTARTVRQYVEKFLSAIRRRY